MQILNSLTDRLTICFLLCEDQAKRINVDADEFEERLYGEGFATEASNALLKETEDFFRKLGQTAMAEIANKSIKSMTTAQDAMAEMVSTGQLDSLLESAFQELNQATQLAANDGAGLQS